MTQDVSARVQATCFLVAFMIEALTLGVFENVRQSPAVRAAAWAMRTGLIGETQAAESHGEIRHENARRIASLGSVRRDRPSARLEGAVARRTCR